MRTWLFMGAAVAGIVLAVWFLNDVRQTKRELVLAQTENWYLWEYMPEGTVARMRDKMEPWEREEFRLLLSDCPRLIDEDPAEVC